MVGHATGDLLVTSMRCHTEKRMSDAIEKRKPGRPIKDRISTRLESGVGDASLQRIRSHTTNILAVMTKEQRFAKYFQHLDDDEKLRLAKELAHEVAYFTLLRHCVSNKPAGRRGPRTKEDQSIFFTQVREKLAGAVVVLPQWKNGSRESR